MWRRRGLDVRPVDAELLEQLQVVVGGVVRDGAADLDAGPRRVEAGDRAQGVRRAEEVVDAFRHAVELSFCVNEPNRPARTACSVRLLLLSAGGEASRLRWSTGLRLLHLASVRR